MRISEMLTAIASWLESPDNEAILLAEYDEECLQIVANSCVQAAALLKITAEAVEDIEPPEESKITPESVEELANLATALDESGDPALQKQASVIDELLLTVASPPDAVAQRQDLLDKRLEEVKKKYEQPRKDLSEVNKIADSEKLIEKSNMTKQMDILEAPLSSRYCPDHPGAQMARVGEHMWQCELDKKIYNFETGFTLNNGTKVPGGDVSNQTKAFDVPFYNIFDSREDRLRQ
jgi:enamine deaminase RidA (YjgF/YER057c/UK114 family)